MNPEEELTYEFPYHRTSRELYTPKAEISLKSHDGEIEEKYEGIVDTGSEITLISLEIVKKFKFIVAGEGVELKTVRKGEKEIVIPYYGQIGLSTQSKKEIQYRYTEIYSCQQESLQQEIILGMNFINEYEMTFSGKNKKLIIKDIKKNRAKQYVKIL